MSIAIIGAGSVGSSIGYCLLNNKVGSKVMMVDVDETRCAGEVLDLRDGSDDLHVVCGTFQEAGQCDIICVTAGAKQKPKETRIALIKRNLGILKSILGSMKPLKKSAILLIIANPCDILTYFARSLSGLPESQVIGSGTFLDSQRLRNFLGQKLSIAESSIHAYVLGEHGDSQFVAWSSATVGNASLVKLLGYGEDEKMAAASSVRDKAQKIIECKGSTYYGIATCVKTICQAILLDTGSVRTVSHFLQEFNVCLSMPAVLGRKGIRQTITPLLSDEEQAKLQESAKALRLVIEEY